MKNIWSMAFITLLISGTIQLIPQVMAKSDQTPPSKTEKSVTKDTKEVKEIKTYQLEKPLKATGSAKPAASPKPKIADATASAQQRTKNGAQFFIQDQASGVVTLVTPSGNTHTLNLPSQAVTNMIRNGVLQTGTATVSAANKADKVASKSATKKGPTAYETTDENGDLVVKQEVSQKKKLFGIIPVNVTLEAMINEKTGKTTFNPNSLFGRILSFLSVE